MGRKGKGKDGADAGKVAAKRVRDNGRSREDRAAVTAAVRASAVRAANPLMPRGARSLGWVDGGADQNLSGQAGADGVHPRCGAAGGDFVQFGAVGAGALCAV